MSIEQQIEELRAELSTCFDRQEARKIAAELEAARADLKQLEAAIEAAGG